MDTAIRLETKKSVKKIDNEKYEEQEFSLLVNNELFNPDIVSRHSKKIEGTVHKIHWDNISPLYLDGCAMIVRLSGLHSNIDEIKKFLGNSIYKRNRIFHHHKWDIDLNGTYDDEKFALIECDRKLFKRLFDKYWFALGFELRFEGIVIELQNLPYFEKWSRMAEGKRKHDSLLKRSLFLITSITVFITGLSEKPGGEQGRLGTAHLFWWAVLLQTAGFFVVIARGVKQSHHATNLL